MTQQELFQLFDKYIRGEASLQEAKTFLRLVDSQEAALLIQAYMNAWQTTNQHFLTEDAEMDRIYQRIHSKIAGTSLPKGGLETSEAASRKRRPLSLRHRTRQLLKAAAVVLIVLFSTALTVYLLTDRGVTPLQTALKDNAFQNTATPPFRKLVQTGAYTENLQLEDHSRVVISAGSRLGITKDFNARQRSVFLDGEAYFDIAHNAGKPFIIHTGPLVVEVLGTAFNVKSFSNQDSACIYVARGKVLIWDKMRKQKQILTAHQSICYQKDRQEFVVRTQNTDEQETLAWASKDMAFDGLSMGQVLSRLSKRYNVKVQSADSALLSSKVKISFTGTESLTNVMEALSLITGSAYELHKDTLTVFKKTFPETK